LGEISDPALRQILAVVCELAAAGHPVSPAKVVSRLSEAGQAARITALVELAQSAASKVEAFADCLRRVRTQTRARELANLREQMRTAQAAGLDAEVQRLLVEYQQRLASDAPTAEPGAVPAGLSCERRG
jgi:replicative DNA helicase